jgi:hypothetical protein
MYNPNLQFLADGDRQNPKPLTEDDFHGSSCMTGRTEHGAGA